MEERTPPTGAPAPQWLLDVPEMAKASQSRSGQWPLTALSRLAASVAPDVAPDTLPPVQWTLQAEHRDAPGDPHQTWLLVRAQAQLAMTCQRCLRPVAVALDVHNALRFVSDEATAAALDEDSDADVLAWHPKPAADALVEDELLLALPLVPRHPVCPVALPHSVGEDPLTAPENPFAVLAQLKKPPSA